MWNYSKNELRTNYLKEKYLLSCSSYQMAVLLQYNDAETLSLDELLEATGISKEILVQVLQVLVKAKILINEEQDQYDLNPSEWRACVCSAVTENSCFYAQTSSRRKSVHFEYEQAPCSFAMSLQIRVNLNLPIKAEVKAESADVLKTVDEDRKYVIQATIVRYDLLMLLSLYRASYDYFYVNP